MVYNGAHEILLDTIDKRSTVGPRTAAKRDRLARRDE